MGKVFVFLLNPQRPGFLLIFPKSLGKVFVVDSFRAMNCREFFENPGEKSSWWIAFGRHRPKAIHHKDFSPGFSKSGCWFRDFLKILRKSLCGG